MERFAKILNIGIIVAIGIVLLDGIGSYFLRPPFPRGENPIFVSPIQLLATPERYNDRKVFTSGYLVLEEENNNLYVSEDAAQHATLDRVDVVFFDTTLPAGDLPKFNRQWVTLNGTFRSNEPSPLVVELMEGIRKPQIRTVTSIRALALSNPGPTAIPLPSK